MLGTTLVAFGAGTLVSALALRWLVARAPRWGLLDHPTCERKNHEAPTPVVGGIGIALGALAAMLVAGTDGGDLRALLALLASGLLVLAVGLHDDLHDTRWTWRLGAQAVAALILVYGGGLSVNHIGTLFGQPIDALGPWSAPFTVFMVVALINALNMADGVDGLTGSVVFVGLAMFAAAALYAGDPALFAVLAGVAGATLGFLRFNLRLPGQPRARTFLGNGGSALLGLVIAWASLRLTQNPAHPVTAVLLPWLLVPPVVDAVALVIRRMVQGRSPFRADRNHLHHFMLDAGYTPTQIAVALAGGSLALGGLAAVGLREDWFGHTELVLAYVAMTIGYFLLSWRRDRIVGLFRAVHPSPAVRAGGSAARPARLPIVDAPSEAPVEAMESNR